MRCWGWGFLPQLLLCLLSPCSATRVVNAGSPIRRVVTLLQMMQKKVSAEGSKEEKLFDTYMCYCRTSDTALQASVTQAETRLPDIESSIKESQAEAQRLTAERAQAQGDLSEAQTAKSNAEQLQSQEQASREAQVAEYRTNIAALANAVRALSGNRSSAFLQSKAAGALRQLSISMEMNTRDRDLVSSFLSQQQSEGYEPRGGEVRGILQQMREDMQNSLQTVEAEGAQAENRSQSMIEAKTQQITALSRQLDQKQSRLGELAVDVVNLQADLDDTTQGLEQDRRFLADLRSGCGNKKTEWVERQKMRGEELQAISDAIKLLNDDEAMTLFKKTMPTPNFVQLSSVSVHRDPQQQALRALEHARRAVGPSRLDLLTTALKAKKVSFTKVVKMIDRMTALLEKEQAEDDKKKNYCRTEIDQSDDQIRDLNLDISDLGKAAEEAKGKVAAVTEEIATLSESIQKLDTQVAQSTQQRKQEHADYVEKLSTNSATKELLESATRTLSKFYQPKQAPDDAGQVFVELAQAQKTGAGAEEKQSPPPETWSGGYKKMDEAGSSVVSLMKQIMVDIEKDTQESQVAEKQAQTTYEEAMADAKSKRAGDARTVAEKEAVKAELEARLHKMKQEKKSKGKEANSLTEYVQDLHSECDWLVANFDVRREARSAEMESLRQAKAVLAGADSEGDS